MDDEWNEYKWVKKRAKKIRDEYGCDRDQSLRHLEEDIREEMSQGEYDDPWSRKCAIDALEAIADMLGERAG